MNIRLISAVIVILLLSGTLLQINANSIKTIPAKPKQGDEITIIFDPSGSGFEKSDNVEMYAYFYSTQPDDVIAISMEKDGNNFTAKLKVGAKTEFIGLLLYNQITYSTNDGKGYKINIYDKSGKELDGSIISSSLLYSTWGKYLGTEENIKLAYENFQKAIKSKPSLKNKYYDDYLTILYSYYKDDRDEQIITELDKFETKGKLSEDDYSLLAKWHRTIKNNYKFEELSDTIAELYPKGIFAQTAAYNKITQEKDMAKKMDLIEQYNSKFPGSKYFSSIVYSANVLLIKDKRYKESAEFIKKYMNLIDVSMLGFFSTVLTHANAELETAMELSKLAVEKAKKNMTDTGLKPPLVTPSKWQETLRTTLMDNLAGLADVYSALGKYDEAIKIYEEAMQNLTGRPIDMKVKEKYLAALRNNKLYDKALDVVEREFSNGAVSQEMRNVAKDVYIKKHGNDAGFFEYISKLEDIAKAKTLVKYKNRLISRIAPDFTLYDLTGKKVKLSECREDIVVLSFWSSVTDPASTFFPVMKQIADKWEGKHVDFLFVNSMETAPADKVKDKNWKKNNASSVLSKGKFKFRVLVDETNEAAALYKLKTLPMQFIIDRDGNIRYEITGAPAAGDDVVDEISAIIELLK